VKKDEFQINLDYYPCKLYRDISHSEYCCSGGELFILVYFHVARAADLFYTGNRVFSWMVFA
jgi:hypothetical protein